MTKENAVTLEIQEPAAPAKKEPVTEASAKEAGLSSAEIASAKKLGIITEKKEEKAPEKKEAEEVKKSEVEEKAPEKKADPELPNDYEKFSPNEKALYWERKKERTKRQRAEADRDLHAIKIKALEKEIEGMKSKAKVEVEEPGKEDEIDIDDILDGKKPKKSVDPKERPLTEADLERREKEKAEKEEQKRSETEVQSRQLKARLEEFEIEAREKYQDFDEVARLAHEILQSGETLFKGDDDRLEFAQDRANRALHSMVNALKWEEGQRTPADLVYSLGKLHPKYRNGAKKSADSGMDPEKMERMIENAGKRSSASVGGGGSGRRVVSEDDLTLEEASKLTPAQYARLSPKTRERLLSM